MATGVSHRSRQLEGGVEWDVGGGMAGRKELPLLPRGGQPRRAGGRPRGDGTSGVVRSNENTGREVSGQTLQNAGGASSV